MRINWCKTNLHPTCYDYAQDHCDGCNIARAYQHGYETAQEDAPKTGKWIDKGWKGDWQFETDGRGNCWHEYECSECGFHNKGSKSNFCPNCGARMRMEDGEV